MLKKKVVACTVNCCTANVHTSFSQEEVFKGTILSKSDGQFTLNSEIFTCDEDGRPNDVGYVSFEFALKNECIEMCQFNITLDFEYKKYI